MSSVDQRSVPTRRKTDIELIVGVFTIVGVLLAAGIAWGTASAAVNQKVDVTTFQAHVAEMQRRFQADSIRGGVQADALQRIERKLDSTNYRLSRLICNRQPSYCQ